MAWSPTQQTFSCRTPRSSARRRTMPPLLAPRAVISSRFTAEATTSYSRLQSWARMASSSCRSRWGSSSNSSLEIGDGAWSRLAICWEGVWVHQLRQLPHMIPDALRQKGGAQIPPRREVVDGRAVEQHRGAVHGHAVHDAGEGGQGPAGGHGKCPALGHKILDGVPVFPGYGRDGPAAAQGPLGIHHGVVKIAGDEHAVKLSHGSALRCRGVAAASAASAPVPGTAAGLGSLLGLACGLLGRLGGGGLGGILGRLGTAAALLGPVAGLAAAAAGLVLSLGGLRTLFSPSGGAFRPFPGPFPRAAGDGCRPFCGGRSGGGEDAPPGRGRRGQSPR